jgi:trimethylamine:corrinoid methyltransferase-like protein
MSVEEARGIAARSAARNTTRATTRAAQAIVVMDLITEEQFQILTEPFAEILVELGIAWEGKK